MSEVLLTATNKSNSLTNIIVNKSLADKISEWNSLNISREKCVEISRRRDSSD